MLVALLRLVVREWNCEAREEKPLSVHSKTIPIARRVTVAVEGFFLAPFTTVAFGLALHLSTDVDTAVVESSSARASEIASKTSPIPPVPPLPVHHMLLPSLLVLSESVAESPDADAVAFLTGGQKVLRSLVQKDAFPLLDYSAFQF